MLISTNENNDVTMNQQLHMNIKESQNDFERVSV